MALYAQENNIQSFFSAFMLALLCFREVQSVMDCFANFMIVSNISIVKSEYDGVIMDRLFLII